MKKVLFYILFIVFICGCSANKKDYSYDELHEEIEKTEKINNSDEEDINEKINIPKSFTMKQIKINNHVVSAASNGRYYIFRAVKGMDSFVEGEMYLYEAYDGLSIRYNPDLMCGDDAMDDINKRGTYCPGEKDFKISHTRETLEEIPIGFGMASFADGDSRVYVWIDEDRKYCIYKAIFNEYEDWYIKDLEDGRVIRYEPSFMTGKEN